MAGIKNDPGKYIQRSALGRSQKDGAEGQPIEPAYDTQRDFLTAHIDARFYVDFGATKLQQES
jgi:hypothetical protein